MNPVAFPVALDLRGKRCVVVGGGSVGGRRAESLLAAGATVVVVDPNCAGVPDGAVLVGEAFVPDHLDNAFLVVVATNSTLVNEAVIRAARERNVLVNAAAPGTGTDSGDFSVMTAVHRGPIVAGVCGGGPGVAKLVRERIDQCLEPWLGEWARLMETARAQVQDQLADETARRACLRNLVNSDAIRECVAVGQLGRASELVDRVVELAAAGAMRCRT